MLVVQTEALCQDNMFQPPKVQKPHEIQCRLVTPDNEKEREEYLNKVDEHHGVKHNGDKQVVDKTLQFVDKMAAKEGDAKEVHVSLLNSDGQLSTDLEKVLDSFLHSRKRTIYPASNQNAAKQAEENKVNEESPTTLAEASQSTEASAEPLDDRLQDL